MSRRARARRARAFAPSTRARLDTRSSARRGAVEVEIGCGKGAFLVAYARVTPEVNLLGIENQPRWVRVGSERGSRATPLAEHARAVRGCGARHRTLRARRQRPSVPRLFPGSVVEASPPQAPPRGTPRHSPPSCCVRSSPAAPFTSPPTYERASMPCSPSSRGHRSRTANRKRSNSDRPSAHELRAQVSDRRTNPSLRDGDEIEALKSAPTRRRLESARVRSGVRARRRGFDRVGWRRFRYRSRTTRRCRTPRSRSAR